MYDGKPHNSLFQTRFGDEPCRAAQESHDFNRGRCQNDLSAQDKNWFMDASIGVAEIDQSVTRAEVLEIFLAMNEGGKPVAKEVLDHARELLNEEKGEEL